MQAYVPCIHFSICALSHREEQSIEATSHCNCQNPLSCSMRVSKTQTAPTLVRVVRNVPVSSFSILLLSLEMSLTEQQ